MGYLDFIKIAFATVAFLAVFMWTVIGWKYFSDKRRVQALLTSSEECGVSGKAR